MLPFGGSRLTSLIVTQMSVGRSLKGDAGLHAVGLVGGAVYGGAIAMLIRIWKPDCRACRC